MATNGAAAILISTLGFFSVIAIVWLIYKWKLSQLRPIIDLSSISPERRFTIHRGKLVPLQVEARKRTSSLIGSIVPGRDTARAHPWILSHTTSHRGNSSRPKRSLRRVPKTKFGVALPKHDFSDLKTPFTPRASFEEGLNNFDTADCPPFQRYQYLIPRTYNADSRGTRGFNPSCSSIPPSSTIPVDKTVSPNGSSMACNIAEAESETSPASSLGKPIISTGNRNSALSAFAPQSRFQVQSMAEDDIDPFSESYESSNKCNKFEGTTRKFLEDEQSNPVEEMPYSQIHPSAAESDHPRSNGILPCYEQFAEIDRALPNTGINRTPIPSPTQSVRYVEIVHPDPRSATAASLPCHLLGTAEGQQITELYLADAYNEIHTTRDETEESGEAGESPRVTPTGQKDYELDDLCSRCSTPVSEREFYTAMPSPSKSLNDEDRGNYFC